MAVVTTVLAVAVILNGVVVDCAVAVLVIVPVAVLLTLPENLIVTDAPGAKLSIVHEMLVVDDAEQSTAADVLVGVTVTEGVVKAVNPAGNESVMCRSKISRVPVLVRVSV